MERPHWTYIGQIDCFGIDPDTRTALLQQAMSSVWHAGGEMQISPADNLYDTDRYDVHCDVPGNPETVVAFLFGLADQLPEEHVPITLQGWDRGNMQREDLVLRRCELSRRVYEWAPAGEQPVRR